MAETKFPPPKSAATATVGPNGGATTPFPPNKAQLYNATRPKYHPQPPPRRRRSCCCRCCLWTTFIITTVLLLATLAGVIFYVMFRPQKPNFTISNLHTSQFNITSTTIISKFNLTISTRNPNAKLTYYYDPISVFISSNDVGISNGLFPSFVHGTKNTTFLKTVLSSSGQTVESTTLTALKTEIKNKKSLPLKIQLETKVKAKIGSVKTKKVTIRVICEGVQFTPPAGKSAATVKTSGVKCKVDPRIKILAWTF
ncbi:hypothetical protein LIER_05445 [Lithospermum erythrorhizon]|uniref:Late embryogenesis abundant protein LEA-2 subgroup domain-containing protein n=1 Tax=Lithospermum erythrorhizon TaxID=34254 RepID=A0AAV3P2E4_LITER